MTDVFRECRERVSAQDAARHYGVELDRRGWALCPFHRDKRPSMSFRDGRYHCWVCDLQGDSIDFTGRLLGLDALGAVRQLNVDFCLGLPLDRKPTKAEQNAARRRAEIAEAHKQFEEWRKAFISKLCAAYRVAHMALKKEAELTEQEVLAVKWQACFEYWADTLSYGTPTDQVEIYKERGSVSKWIERALTS